MAVDGAVDNRVDGVDDGVGNCISFLFGTTSA